MSCSYVCVYPLGEVLGQRWSLPCGSKQAPCRFVFSMNIWNCSLECNSSNRDIVPTLLLQFLWPGTRIEACFTRPAGSRGSHQQSSHNQRSHLRKPILTRLEILRDQDSAYSASRPRLRLFCVETKTPPILRRDQDSAYSASRPRLRLFCVETKTPPILRRDQDSAYLEQFQIRARLAITPPQDLRPPYQDPASRRQVPGAQAKPCQIFCQQQLPRTSETRPHQRQVRGE